MSRLSPTCPENQREHACQLIRVIIGTHIISFGKILQHLSCKHARFAILDSSAEAVGGPRLTRKEIKAIFLEIRD
jgi:hypothetical protein